MAAFELAKDWPAEKCMELVSRIGEDNAKALLRGELEISFSRKINSLFTSANDQIVRWREWLPQLRQEHNVTVGDEVFNAFATIEVRLSTFGRDRLTVVTLVLRGPTAAQELQLYWPLIAAQQEASRKWDQLNLDDDHVRWYAGSENPAKDWHFEWQVIDLGSNRNTTTETVRQAVQTPLCNTGILAAAALHPQWIRSMNGDDVPFVDLPGYEISVPGYQPWRVVPRLCFSCGLRLVRLGAGHCGSAPPGWGVPSLAGVK